MKQLLFFVLLLSVAPGFAQEVNQLDAEGRKHGLWRGVYEESKRPRYEGTFEHGVETGTFKYFDDTKTGGIIATRVFTNNGHNAYTTLFTRKGNKVSEGLTVDRVNEGKWIYYHEDLPDVMTTETYVKGKLEGVRKVFFRGGAIAEECGYRNDLKDGLYKKYTEKGIVLEESHYRAGQPEGHCVYRDAEGHLVAEGEYVDGAKKGIWTIRDENNKLTKVRFPLLTKKFGKPKKK